MNEMYSYYAFISYKHEDEKWAKWLQKRLENYRLPAALQKLNYPKHLKPIFKDTTDLAPGPLLDSLREKIAASRYLIVICSRNLARESAYVDFEIQTFASFGRMDRIIPFIVDGEPHAQDPQNECFSAFLRSLPVELLAADVTKDGKRLASLKVLAALLQLNADEIINRDARRRKQQYAAFSCAAAVLAITAGMTLSSVLNMTAQANSRQASLYFSQNKYIQAAEAACKSLQIPGHRDELSETAAILRSGVLHEDLRNSNSLFHKEYEIEKYNEDVFLLANSPDADKVAFCDYSRVWIHDTATGELLEVFSYNDDRAAIEEYLGAEIPESFISVGTIGHDETPYEPKKHIEKIEEKESYDVLKFYTAQDRYENLMLIDKASAKWSYTADESLVAVYRGNAYADRPNAICVYSFETDTELPIALPAGMVPKQLRLSPMGKYLFVFASKYSLYVYDVQSGRTVAELCENDENMMSTQVTSILAEDPTQIFFYLPDKIEKYTYADAKPQLKGLFFDTEDIQRVFCYDTQISSDGKKAYIVHEVQDNDYTSFTQYTVFDVQSGAVLWKGIFDTWKEPVCLTPDFSLLLYGASDRIVVYDCNEKAVIFEKDLYSDTVVSVGLNEDGSYGAFATESGRIYGLVKTDNGYETTLIDLVQKEDQFVVSVVTGSDLIFKAGSQMMRYSIASGEKIYSEKYMYQEGSYNITQNHYVDRYSLVKSEKYSNGMFIEHEEVFTEFFFTNYDTAEIYDFGFLWLPCAYSSQTQLFAGFSYTNQMQINSELTMMRLNGMQRETLYTYTPQSTPENVMFDNTGTYVIVLTQKGSEVLDAQSGALLFSLDRTVRIHDGVVYDVSDDLALPAAMPTAKIGTLAEFLARGKEIIK